MLWGGFGGLYDCCAFSVSVLYINKAILKQFLEIRMEILTEEVPVLPWKGKRTEEQ